METRHSVCRIPKKVAHRHRFSDGKSLDVSFCNPYRHGMHSFLGMMAVQPNDEMGWGHALGFYRNDAKNGNPEGEY